MEESNELTVDNFQRKLGQNYKIWEGKFKEEIFVELLNKYSFDTDVVNRESLRIQLKDLGFFEQGKIIFSSDLQRTQIYNVNKELTFSLEPLKATQ